MEALFSTIVNMSISGAIVILWVLAARLALRKMPRVFSYCLWAAVLLRLLCPVSFTGPVSVLQTVPAQAPIPQSPQAVSRVEYFHTPVETPVETIVTAEMHPEVPSVSVEPAPRPVNWREAAAHIWATGVGAMVLSGIASYLRLKRRLRESAPVSKGVREADGIQTPFVLGIFRPTVYLPSSLREEEREYILLHERFHIRHGDPLVRTVFFVALALHWFNPLVWLAFRCACRDMEMRCDEAVLKTLTPAARCDYAQSLLTMATGRWNLCAPLAFGEGDTGSRVKNVLRWKRRAAWTLIPTAVLCVLVLTLTACNPGQSLFPENPFGHSYRMDLITDSTREEVAPAGRFYTLTSDQALYIRDNSITEYLGTFQKARFDDTYPDGYQKTELQENCRRVWKLSTGDWWLLGQRDGTFWLVHEEAAFSLKRADLMGIVIRQPGVESHVEPMWYSANTPSWYTAMTVDTEVAESAEIEFLPEVPTDSLNILEEYHRHTAAGVEVTSTNIDLPADEDGAFLLNIARRSDGADYAHYTVVLGEDTYSFTVNFSGKAQGSEPTGESRTPWFRADNVYLQLEIPDGWDYQVTDQGISFWPQGHAREQLDFLYYPDKFGVCGTGLENYTLELAGHVATAGVYDGGQVWSHISFPGLLFAVTGRNHESWWGEYGDEAMEILDSAVFGEDVDRDMVTTTLISRHPEEGTGVFLGGEGNYMAVLHPKSQTIHLYDLRPSGSEANIFREWTAPFQPDSPVTLNVLEAEGKYIYFGVFHDRFGVESDESPALWADLNGGSFHFLLEDGYCYDLILNGEQGFCFLTDSPVKDFQLLSANQDMVMTLEQYLSEGFPITPAT